MELFVLNNNTWNHLTLYKLKLFVLDRNTGNHLTVYKQMIYIKLNYSYWIEILKTLLTVCKQMSYDLFKMLPTNYSFSKHIYLIHIYVKTIFGIK